MLRSEQTRLYSCQTLLSPQIEFPCLSEYLRLLNPGNEANILVIYVAHTSVKTDGHRVNTVVSHFMDAKENDPSTILRNLKTLFARY
jgi:hypothetical protein